MRIYLAARWGRREELRGYAEQLRNAGHGITSRWLYGHESESKDDGTNMHCSDEEKMRFATEDLEDIIHADMVMSFTDGVGTPAGGRARGGRHAEFGYAAALGKYLWVIGPKEHVFHWLPKVGHHDNFEDALRMLTEWTEKMDAYARAQKDLAEAWAQ